MGKILISMGEIPPIPLSTPADPCSEGSYELIVGPKSALTESFIGRARKATREASEESRHEIAVLYMEDSDGNSSDFDTALENALQADILQMKELTSIVHVVTAAHPDGIEAGDGLQGKNHCSNALQHHVAQSLHKLALEAATARKGLEFKCFLTLTDLDGGLLSPILYDPKRGDCVEETVSETHVSEGEARLDGLIRYLHGERQAVFPPESLSTLISLGKWNASEEGRDRPESWSMSSQWSRSGKHRQPQFSPTLIH